MSDVGMGLGATPLIISTMPFMAGAAGGIPTIMNVTSKILSNPLVDAGLTTHGIISAPDNIKEGINEIKSGNYGIGALDFGLTALDMLGAGELAFRTGRMLHAPYRAKHAYNTIAPIGYQRPVDRGIEWLHDMWYNEPVDVKNPKWYKELKEYFGDRP